MKWNIFHFSLDPHPPSQKWNSVLLLASFYDGKHKHEAWRPWSQFFLKKWNNSDHEIAYPLPPPPPLVKNISLHWVIGFKVFLRRSLRVRDPTHVEVLYTCCLQTRVVVSTLSWLDSQSQQYVDLHSHDTVTVDCVWVWLSLSGVCCWITKLHFPGSHGNI